MIEHEYVYMKVVKSIEALIDDGSWKPGAMLPNERTLAYQHGVSLGTVRRATEILRERGRLITLPCKGTYVAE